MSIEDLIVKLVKYNPGADISLLRRAYEFAREAHNGQMRISGEEYISHPLAVAMILSELDLDLQTLLAGILHDVVEDTSVTLDQISAVFGEEVASLVDGVTKLGRLEFKSKEEQQAENLRKMFLAMAKDIRVILIKLADRLHNLRTLMYHPKNKQREIAKETLEIYAPLAHRLGIYHLKGELEDLAFSYLYSNEYNDLTLQIAQSMTKREELINEVIRTLRDKLASVGIEADIQGRPKHLYSIFIKMKAQQKDLSEIYDVMAVRIIVGSVRDCYASLGTVHTVWKPIPGRFKDYIAMPKTNMYQSLHTTVIGPTGEPLEIQIRTQEMHRTAEYGIAAHWRYKEGGRGDKDFNKKLAWLRQLMEWQHDLRDAREFMETLKIDLFADAVFVFTPDGDVFELPAGSVPIDFAYRVHTQVGHSCVGAKVNGRIVPLDYKLKNGDIVEVITSKNPVGPSRDWLNLVKTSQAKNRIRQWYKKEKREENIIKGRDMLDREAKKAGLAPEALKSDRLLEIAKRYTFVTLDDIYAALGEGAITTNLIIGRLKEGMVDKKAMLAEEYQALMSDGKTAAKPAWGRPTQGIRVRGVDNLLIRLAHCCNPIPGDSIVGYITRGRGVSIHQADCRNLNYHMRTDESRMVEVTWDIDFQNPFQVKLEIQAADRAGLLNDILAVLMEVKMSANWVNARGRKDIAIIELVLEMKTKEQLDYIMAKMTRVKDVYEVHRTS